MPRVRYTLRCMDFNVFLRSIALGFGIAAPVGPIGLLCIRRTLAQGRAYGLATGLGAATADAFYGAVAAFGVSFIANALTGQQFWLKLVGGAFLCYLGAKTFFSAPAPKNQADGARAGLLSAYGSTVLLTLTNPATILMFAALFASMGATDAPGAVVLGVFIGSALWWLTLSALTGFARKVVSPALMVWINRLSGALIFAFGLLSIFSALI